MGETGVAAQWQGWKQLKAKPDHNGPPTPPRQLQEGPSRVSRVLPLHLLEPWLGWATQKALWGSQKRNSCPLKALEPSSPATSLSLAPQPSVLLYLAQLPSCPARILSPNPIPVLWRETDLGTQWVTPWSPPSQFPVLRKCNPKNIWAGSPASPEGGVGNRP